MTTALGPRVITVNEQTKRIVDAMRVEDNCGNRTVHVTSIDWPKYDLIMASLTIKQIKDPLDDFQLNRRDSLSTMIF